MFASPVTRDAIELGILFLSNILAIILVTAIDVKGVVGELFHINAFPHTMAIALFHPKTYEYRKTFYML
jgi:hypothetical protein